MTSAVPATCTLFNGSRGILPEDQVFLRTPDVPTPESKFAPAAGIWTVRLFDLDPAGFARLEEVHPVLTDLELPGGAGRLSGRFYGEIFAGHVGVEATTTEQFVVLARPEHLLAPVAGMINVLKYGSYALLGIVDDSGIEWQTQTGEVVFDNPAAAFLANLVAQNPPSTLLVAAGIEALLGTSALFVPCRDQQHQLLIGPMYATLGNRADPDVVTLANPGGISSTTFAPGLDHLSLATYQQLRASGLSDVEALEAVALIAAGPNSVS